MGLFRFCVIVVIVAGFIGCSTGTVVDVKNSSVAGNIEKSSDDVLMSALYQVRPENFGINSTTDKPVSLLNSWRFEKAEQTKIPDGPVPVEAPAGWVVAEDEARLAQAKFDFIDAVHIRDALFHHTIAGYLSDRGRDELQRVAIVVDFVCRNVSLWKDDELEISLSPFLSLQIGKGSVEDRALVCSEILRQLRIDSVIVRSKKDVKESTENWLFGVIVDNQIFLFDLRLGMPIPDGLSDTASSTSIATLAQLPSHPEWLDALSAGEPYRMTADDIRDATIFVASNPMCWCLRMQKLEQDLPAEEICVLYDPLLDKGQNSGLLHRIASASARPIESLKQWGFPQRQIELARHPTKESSQELQRLTIQFNVPIPFKIGDDGKIVMGNPERKLQKFRTGQLTGKFAEATQRYLSIRHLEVEPNPPELDRLNRMASEDAFFWTSLCKYELGELDSAIEQLAAYLKKYDRKGKWFFDARSLLARSYAESGQFPKAISMLERTSSDDPYRLANAVHVKKWATARAKSDSKPPRSE